VFYWCDGDTEIIKNFRKARKHRSIAMQVLHLVAHKLNLNTHWEDYYRFGLYRQDMPWSEKALYVSDYSCEGVQHSSGQPPPSSETRIEQK
jgi:hypothetical protein